jgi:hypothetical protein
LLSLLFRLCLEDILLLDFSISNFSFKSCWKSDRTQLEEVNEMVSCFSNSCHKCILHLGLYFRPFLEELIGIVKCRNITDDIEDDSGKNCLFLISILCVDLEDFEFVNFVLQRGFQVKFQTILGSALNHWECGLECL